jgi:molecular chaperone HtpG
MELNPSHDIVARLKARFDQDAADPVIDDYAELLFGQGLLVEGSELPDPVRFNRALADLMTRVA